MSYKVYRIRQDSPRKHRLEFYSVYVDGGPYCLSWVPIRKAEISQGPPDAL